jgi:predicted HD phosphohydrolase
MKEHWQRKKFLNKDPKHEIVGANWLQQFFPEQVTESIRLHVPAKRYLCAVDAQYWSGLSDGSKTSLVKQGGPMTEREVDEFELTPGYEAAVRLRRIDDRAKVVGLDVPPLSHYDDAVLSLLTALIQR